jgi:DNA-binding NarL/FixJ family response regulator
MATEALHAGASGFVHAGLSPERIALALSLALEGEVVISRQLLKLPLGTAPLYEVAQALRL